LSKPEGARKGWSEEKKRKSPARTKAMRSFMILVELVTEMYLDGR